MSMTPTTVEIAEPIWNGGEKKVGIKGKELREGGSQITLTPSTLYTVRVLYTNKSGIKSVPQDFYIRGREIQTYPLIPTKKYPNVFLHWVPINDLSIELPNKDICLEHNAIKLKNGLCPFEIKETV